MENTNRTETQAMDQPSEQPPSSSSGRNYWYFLLILAAFVLIYWYSSRSSSPPGPAVSLSTALVQAAEQNKPVFLKFEAGWCPPCQWMDQEVFTKEAVQRALADWVVLGVDVDTNHELATQYRVASVPTFVVLSPQGREIARHDGAMPVEQLLAFLQAVRVRINSAS